jgi:hypothetical protein
LEGTLPGTTLLLADRACEGALTIEIDNIKEISNGMGDITLMGLVGSGRMFITREERRVRADWVEIPITMEDRETHIMTIVAETLITTAAEEIHTTMTGEETMTEEEVQATEITTEIEEITTVTETGEITTETDEISIERGTGETTIETEGETSAGIGRL